MQRPNCDVSRYMHNALQGVSYTPTFAVYKRGKKVKLICGAQSCPWTWHFIR